MRIDRTSRARLALSAALISACGGGGGGSGGPTQPPGNGPTPVLTSITIAAPSTSMAVSSSLQLAASPMDQFGIAFNASIAWTSSNRSVADVDVSGLVWGINPGTATLTAQSGTVSGSTLITVTGGGTFPLQRTVQMPSSPAFAFSPSQTDIAVTGSVVFEFAVDDHNVVFTSATGSGKPSDIPPAHGTNVARQFNTKGAFPYVCTLHSGMEGTVVVH